MKALLDILTAKSQGQRWEKIKQLVGALGHEPGWAQKLRAELLARGRRRVDRVADLAAALPGRAGFESLAGRRIMEFGVGYVLSVPIVYWLAGAREVVATDYFAILDLPASRRALHKSDRASLVRKLSTVAKPDEIESRLAALLGLGPWTLEELARLGIRYRAPVDAAEAMPTLGKFDCILSNSTMEHVPAALALSILSNLQDLLIPGGCQIHTIHLADHRDLARAPFAFLGADDDYEEGQSDARGNRLRASDWMTIAGRVSGAETRSLGARVKADATLPYPLAPKFADYARDDLLTTTLSLSLCRPV